MIDPYSSQWHEMPGHPNTYASLDKIDTSPISMNELLNANLTPREIVPNFLYADLRFRIAAGGVGKTTLACFEAIVLALGRELWGRQPADPVRTCFVTREDCREILVARIREIIVGLHLSVQDCEQVLRNVRIFDMSNVNFRVCKVNHDVVEPNEKNIDWLLLSLKSFKPDWVIIDPLVSFGVGEARVNDAEQGLIDAFRIIRNSLDCCIEGIHHTGKANARDKVDDQYAGRGGSALPDGSRMMTVIHTLKSNEWLKATGKALAASETGLKMTLPKLSFCTYQEPIYIVRTDFSFRYVEPIAQTKTKALESDESRLLSFISSSYLAGQTFSKADLDSRCEEFCMTRKSLRAAMQNLTNSGQICYTEVKGRTGSHYKPKIPPKILKPDASQDAKLPVA